MQPRISSAEWEVMNVLWDRSPLNAAEVFAGLPAGHGWSQKTVNTFLARLVRKGVLRVTKDGNANRYVALVKRAKCVAREGESFLQRVFNGAAGSLVLHFCERAELSTDEIDQLEALLKSKKGRK